MDRREFLKKFGAASLVTVLPAFVFADDNKKRQKKILEKELNSSDISLKGLNHPLLIYNFKKLRSNKDSIDFLYTGVGTLTLLNDSGLYISARHVIEHSMAENNLSIVYDPVRGIIMDSEVYALSEYTDLAIGRVHVPLWYQHDDTHLGNFSEHNKFISYSNYDAIKFELEEIIGNCRVMEEFGCLKFFRSDNLKKDVGLFSSDAKCIGNVEEGKRVESLFRLGNSGSPVYNSNDELAGIYIGNIVPRGYTGNTSHFGKIICSNEIRKFILETI